MFNSLWWNLIQSQALSNLYLHQQLNDVPYSPVNRFTSLELNALTNHQLLNPFEPLLLNGLMLRSQVAPSNTDRTTSTDLAKCVAQTDTPDIVRWPRLTTSRLITSKIEMHNIHVSMLVCMLV